MTNPHAGRIAVDIGGTFTDLTATMADGRVVVSKVPTTPEDHAMGVLRAISRTGIELSSVELILHGSTVAINTLIEEKGVATGLLTTDGFRDVYEIGRSNRPDAYNVFFQRPKPLIPRHLRKEVSERVTAAGSIKKSLDREHAAGVVKELRALGVEAIAVCLLHSYANPEHERILGDLVRELHPEAYASLSHRILREYREYERTSTTAVNAYVGPVVARYLNSLDRRLRESAFSGSLLIMQSSGGVMSLDAALEAPVRMMESGPVAGVMGAAEVARRCGCPNAIAFDMGGTTAKASLLHDGVADVSGGYFVGGYETGHPIMLPVVDIVEVGSGGGSIAWMDSAGSLKVGPASAGARPGPACYGHGGVRPTVTDANLILGRLGGESFLGGAMPLDLGSARDALEREIARPLNMELSEAASGVIRIADAHMGLAIRAVSVEKGKDPREFALIAFGGAGPLHACGLARALHIPKVIVPNLPGQFSALGMLQSEIRRDYVQTLLRDMAEMDLGELNGKLEAVVGEAMEAVAHELPSKTPVPTVSCFLDLRYRGQEFTISIAVPRIPLNESGLAAIVKNFHTSHEAQYGHSASDQPVETVALRVTSRAAMGTESPQSSTKPPDHTTRSSLQPHSLREVYIGPGIGFVETPVYARTDIPPGALIEGAAIIEEPAATTFVLPDDRATVTDSGEIVISIQGWP